MFKHLLLLFFLCFSGHRMQMDVVDDDMGDDKINIGGEEKDNENCDVKLAPDTRVMPQQSQLRMVSHRKEESKEQVDRRNLPQTHCGEHSKELPPRVEEKVETYTETYVVTQIKSRVLTRRRKFIQRRKLIRQKVNNPVLVIKKKTIKERQVYERIVPRVIETRQVINHQKETSRIVTEPMIEITTAPADACGDDFATTECPPGFEAVDDNSIPESSFRSAPRVAFNPYGMQSRSAYRSPYGSPYMGNGMQARGSTYYPYG